MLGPLHPANKIGEKRYFLSNSDSTNNQCGFRLMPYQIISTQHSDISLQGWATSEKTSPIRICPICIPVSKYCASLSMKLMRSINVALTTKGKSKKLREIIVSFQWP
jgi:hypothetical protein